MNASKVLSSALLLLISMPLTAQPQLKVKDPANKAIQAVAKRVSPQGTLHLKAGQRQAPADFLADHKAAFGLTVADHFEETRREVLETGEEVVRFQQYHNGIPVEGGEYIVFRHGDELAKIKGRGAESLDFSRVGTLDREKALGFALELVPAEVYAWEAPTKNLSVEAVAEIQQAYPEGKLVIVRDPLSTDDAPRHLLTWRFEVRTLEPLAHDIVYLDAHTGELVKTLTGLHTASNATGTVHTVYNGTHTLSTRKRGFPNYDYILKDKTRGEITVKNYSNVASWGWGLAGHIDQGSNTWSKREASVHWAAQESHDYFKNSHGRSGVNGSNEELRIHANAFTSAYSDAGSCSNMYFMTSHETLDVVGHEFTHGVIRHSSNLVYERESGALNESFADIFGTMVEHQVEGSGYDWLMGADFGAIRSLSNPNIYGDPSTRGGAFWINQVGCSPSGNNDWCGVHTNSGVQNRWFSLLVDGGFQNGVSVSGVGEVAAARVAYRNMTSELTATSDYDDAREGAIDAAEAIYGACSNVVKQVTNAWAAVGVGGTFGTCVPPLSAYISGVTSGYPNSSYRFSAVVNGTGPFTYRWYVGSTQVGTGSSIYRSFSTTGTHTLRLTVSDTFGQSRTDYHYVSISTGGGGGCDDPILQKAIVPCEL